MWCPSNTASTHADFQFRKEGQRSIKEYVSSWASIEDPRGLKCQDSDLQRDASRAHIILLLTGNPEVFAARLMSTDGRTPMNDCFGGNRLWQGKNTDGILVWAGVTGTFGPKNGHKAIHGLIILIVKQMRTDGVLP